MDQNALEWRLFYNREHEPIEDQEAMRLIRDLDYRRIAQTVVGEYMISTIFLVADHGCGSPHEPPVLYETMVFKRGDFRHEVRDYTERYYSPHAALAGHDQIAAELRYVQSL